MGGERVSTSFVGRAGLVGDRVWALCEPNLEDDRPWITAREQPSLVLFRASFGARLTEGTLTLRTPDGTEHVAAGDELQRLLATLLGREVGVRRSDRNLVDAYPLSLIG